MTEMTKELRNRLGLVLEKRKVLSDRLMTAGVARNDALRTYNQALREFRIEDRFARQLAGFCLCLDSEEPSILVKQLGGPNNCNRCERPLAPEGWPDNAEDTKA